MLKLFVKETIRYSWLFKLFIKLFVFYEVETAVQKKMKLNISRV